jgi:hypothetical protein
VVLRSGRIRAIALEYHQRILQSRGLDPMAIHRGLIECGYQIDSGSGGHEPDVALTEIVLYVRTKD